MDPSSLIFVAIVAIWAAYLLGHWVRRRDQARHGPLDRPLQRRHARARAPDAGAGGAARPRPPPVVRRRAGPRADPGGDGDEHRPRRAPRTAAGEGDRSRRARPRHRAPAGAPGPSGTRSPSRARCGDEARRSAGAARPARADPGRLGGRRRRRAAVVARGRAHRRTRRPGGAPAPRGDAPSWWPVAARASSADRPARPGAPPAARWWRSGRAPRAAGRGVERGRGDRAGEVVPTAEAADRSDDEADGGWQPVPVPPPPTR
nr:hypothetical protein [Angustibacter aerolatus]